MWEIGELDFLTPLRVLFDFRLFLSGAPFSAAIIAILLSHEMGHYLLCRRHGIYATLPHFIPVPPPLSPFGTFGALIRIKSAFYNVRQLFDVGVAGPLAGFVVMIPTLIIGIMQAHEFEGAQGGEFLSFGEPLLFRLAARLFFSGSPDHVGMNAVTAAAWFGMLATSLNLLPIGQLDGGHIVYALFGPRGHRIVSLATLLALAYLGVTMWSGYLFFGALAFFIGFRHPPTMSDRAPLGAGRIALAILALIVFIVTFMPVPVRIVEDLSGV